MLETVGLAIGAAGLLWAISTWLHTRYRAQKQAVFERTRTQDFAAHRRALHALTGVAVRIATQLEYEGKTSETLLERGLQQLQVNNPEAIQGNLTQWVLSLQVKNEQRLSYFNTRYVEFSHPGLIAAWHTCVVTLAPILERSRGDGTITDQDLETFLTCQEAYGKVFKSIYGTTMPDTF